MNSRFDLVIRNATIADGTGAELREGDVAVSGARIAAVGGFAGSGAQEIGAKGCLIAPGFVDIHTHNDGQAGGKRLLQKAEGYVATVVSGVVGYRDGAPTGALAGRLMRGRGARQLAAE